MHSYSATILCTSEEVYEKFDQKTEMNQNGGISSSIEQHLLYNMRWLVFPPPLILKGTALKDIFITIFSANSDEYIIEPFRIN